MEETEAYTSEGINKPLVHGDLDLDGSIDLDGGDALDNLHRTMSELLPAMPTPRDQSLSCGFSSPDAPRCWYPLRKETLRVVIRRNLVGIRTGPATLTFLLRAIRLISAQTRKSTTHKEQPTLLHGLDVGGSQSNTDAVHLLVDNFILLH